MTSPFPTVPAAQMSPYSSRLAIIHAPGGPPAAIIASAEQLPPEVEEFQPTPHSGSKPAVAFSSSSRCPLILIGRLEYSKSGD